MDCSLLVVSLLIRSLPGRNLTDYEKVLFVDADKIVLSNCDSLFDLRAPAGTFSSPWCVLEWHLLAASP